MDSIEIQNLLVEYSKEFYGVGDDEDISSSHILTLPELINSHRILFKLKKLLLDDINYFTEGARELI